MRTRHLVSLVTGILIFSVLVPVCLSIWLAHRQAEDKFVDAGNDSNLLIVFYVQIMPDDFVMQLHRF